VIVVLGASNVARGLPELIAAARARAGGPHDLHVAGGHGRSYGLDTRVLGRGLPAIRACGILGQLARLDVARGPVHVAITDVGNDVAYGVGTERILAWIEECLEARPAGATVSLGLPPTGPLGRLSDRTLLLLRLLFFPSSRVTVPELRERLDALDRGLRELARRADATLDPAPEWYGWDPIHVRRRHRATVWRLLLARGDEELLPAIPARARDQLARLARPRRWSLLGLRLQGRQPARQAPDGSRLWLW
jgi:hypothetical protein